jgi:hypothetical protein
VDRSKAEAINTLQRARVGSRIKRFPSSLSSGRLGRVDGCSQSPGPRSSGVEHFLGKEEVIGSKPIVGSSDRGDDVKRER